MVDAMNLQEVVCSEPDPVLTEHAVKPALRCLGRFVLVDEMEEIKRSTFEPAEDLIV